MTLYTFTEKEMTKLQIIEKRDKKYLDIVDVCNKISCSEGTAYRYLKRFREEGPTGILHGLKGKASNNRGKGSKLDEIRKYAEAKKYEGFGPTILQECLIEELGRDEGDIKVETLRLKMIERGMWEVKTRKTEIIRQKRKRREQKGMMIQFDGSYHIWLEDGNENVLVAMNRGRNMRTNGMNIYKMRISRSYACVLVKILGEVRETGVDIHRLPCYIQGKSWERSIGGGE